MSDEARIKTLVFLPKLVLFLCIRLLMFVEKTNPKIQTHPLSKVADLKTQNKTLKIHTYHQASETCA